MKKNLLISKDGITIKENFLITKIFKINFIQTILVVKDLASEESYLFSPYFEEDKFIQIGKIDENKIKGFYVDPNDFISRTEERGFITKFIFERKEKLKVISFILRELDPTISIKQEVIDLNEDFTIFKKEDFLEKDIENYAPFETASE